MGHARRCSRLRLFTLAVLMTVGAPAISAAQSDEHLWSYAFASPVVFYDSVTIARTFVPGTPQAFDVVRTRDVSLHWGFGFEWQVYKALGLAAEIGAMHLALEGERPGGLLAVNGSYHFGDITRRVVPFATGGYSFGINSNHGFDIGAGANWWIRPKVGLRFEVRGTAWRGVSFFTVPGQFEPYAWAIAGRAAVNFGRK
jgi:hypothetical protein